MKYLQEFLYCEFFCQCHFLWDLFILLITITFLNYIDKFAFTLFFGLHAQISWMAAVSTSPWLATYFFHKRITFVLTYTSSVIILCFFAILASLLAHSLFQLWIFVKCHMDLSLGDKGATQLRILRVTEWQMWSDQSKTLKEVTLLVIGYDPHLLFM